MSQSSEQFDTSLTRDLIIGLGESSFRKNYYPALQKKIADLELINGRYRNLIETIPDILLVYKKDNAVLSAPFEQKHAGIVKALLEDSEVSHRLKETVESALSENRLATEMFHFKYEGKELFFEARANCNEIDDVLIILRDMTEKMNAEERLREMALKDSLTKLYNRRYFEQQVDSIQHTLREKLTILLMDIDGLKFINDALGHATGDEMLVASADILRQTFDQSSVIARIGGDEFAVIAEGFPQKTVESFLTKMNRGVEQFNTENPRVRLSVSYGYSHLKSGIADMKQMFSDADNKMYQNKLLKEDSIRNSLVKTLMSTLEAKDFVTEGHVQRMENYAVMMGNRLSLPQDMIDRIKLLAKFHDIGKVGIPDRILNKPDRLVADEWEVMKTHSTIGKKIAESSHELKEISELILLHHERWDGTGYPYGLKGEEIPLECRILSIVDAFDAMTNDRPYRKALHASEAIAEIENFSNRQFDASLAELFIRIVRAENERAVNY